MKNKPSKFKIAQQVKHKYSDLLTTLLKPRFKRQVSLNMVVIEANKPIATNTLYSKNTNANKNFLSHLLAQLKQCEFSLNKHQLTSLIVKNNMMSPLFYKNDIVIINANKRFSKEGIYAIKLNGETIICRIQALLNGYQLLYENPEYKSQTLTSNDNFQIIGHVEWKLSKTYESR